MKRWLILTMLAASVLLAENLVKNGGFDEGEVRLGELPSGWNVLGEQLVGWRYINDDGVSGACCLQAVPDNGRVTPLTQGVACEPSKDYTLKAAFKVDGCRPVVAVLTADDKKLASLVADDKEVKVWKEKSVAFKTGADDKKLTVIVAADGQTGSGSAFATFTRQNLARDLCSPSPGRDR